MSRENYAYMWRCAKCFNHFANITKVEGILRQEKKCPKCKSINILTLTPKEISLHCKLYDPTLDNYGDEVNQIYNHTKEDY